MSDHLYEKLRWLQVIMDAMSAVMVLLIAAELVPFVVASIAGSLVALSPHLAYYSLYGTPDSLAVPPILLSVYLVIQAMKRPRLAVVLAAGALIGLSCWLKASAMLLAPVIAAALWVLVDHSERWRHAIALVSATIIVILPITIRNWAVFNSFVPISIGFGRIFVEGIANHDKDGRFGMPGPGITRPFCKRTLSGMEIRIMPARYGDLMGSTATAIDSRAGSRWCASIPAGLQGSCSDAPCLWLATTAPASEISLKTLRRFRSCHLGPPSITL